MISSPYWHQGKLVVWISAKTLAFDCSGSNVHTTKVIIERKTRLKRTVQWIVVSTLGRPKFKCTLNPFCVSWSYHYFPDQFIPHCGGGKGVMLHILAWASGWKTGHNI